jgi:hypothetical protein
MLPPSSLVDLTDADRLILARTLAQKWKKQKRTMLFSLLLPVIFGGIPAIFVGLSWAGRYSLSDGVAGFMGALIFLSYPVLFIAIAANIILLLTGFRALYADRKSGKKLRIPFHPEPYCIPDVGRYYVKTNISQHPHFPISREAYSWMNSSQVLYLEMAPRSKVLFDVKAGDELDTQSGTLQD